MMKLLLLLIPLLLSAQKPSLMLLQTYNDHNISGWVMSEKLDGIRAYWDGTQLLTRNGNIIHAPSWFTAAYPPFAVDGELWIGRKQFEHTAAIVRDNKPSDQWREITHYIFEVPHAKGTLAQRLARVRPYEHRYLKCIPHIKVTDKNHLYAYLKAIEAKGGEGVVVRDPNAPYIARRTHKALKVKTFHDAECEIVGYNNGKGKYRGVLGSFTCKMNSGTLFKIGSGLSEALRRNPPKIGTVVTFKYQELTQYGKPRFPVFLRVKRDR